MSRILNLQLERFAELITKSALTMSDIMEIEDMPFVEKIEQVEDKVLIKTKEKNYELNFKED